MTRDLDAALRDLAGAASAAHRDRADRDGDALLAPTVRRVRRRRTLRGAATATGGLVVVAGLVVGGMALGQEPPPQPARPSPAPSPSTEAPRPTPTPTPTTAAPPAVVLPRGDASLPFGVCGSLRTSAPATPDDPAFLATAVPQTTTVTAGGHVAVMTEVALAEPAADDLAPRTEGAVHAGGTNVAVVRDGVVVATAAFGDDAWTFDYGIAGSLASSLDWVPLAVCAPDGEPEVSAGAPLPAGTYELVPWADVINLGTSHEALPTDSGGGVDLDAAVATMGEHRTATGPASTLTITGTAPAMAPVPGADQPPVALPTVAPPVCGEAPPEPDPASPLRLTTSVDGGTVRVVDLDSAVGELTYTGGGRTSLSVGALWAMVVSDGRIVGHSAVWYEPGGGMRFGSGIPYRITVPVMGLAACTPGEVVYTSDGVLAPGTYELVLALEHFPLTGDALPSWSTVVGQRATLVVD